MFSSQLYNQATSWPEITAVLETMEQGRWESVYFYDHFVPPWSHTAEIRESDTIDTLEGITLMAAAAAVTTRLKLGVLVAGNTYRNPALMAKMVATMDMISNGRAQYCIGAGWNIREHEAYGWDFPSMRERSDRLEEACELVKRLFTNDGMFDYDGKYYQLKSAPFAPKGVQNPIPIMVGGNGEKRTLRTAAKYADICNLVGVSPNDIRHKKEVLHRHCEAVGRDPSEIKMSAHVPMRIERDEEKAKQLRGGRDHLMIGSPQYVIDRCADYIDAGSEEFMLQSILQRPDIYAELNAEIFPAFD